MEAASETHQASEIFVGVEARKVFLVSAVERSFGEFDSRGEVVVEVLVVPHGVVLFGGVHHLAHATGVLVGGSRRGRGGLGPRQHLLPLQHRRLERVFADVVGGQDRLDRVGARRWQLVVGGGQSPQGEIRAAQLVAGLHLLHGDHDRHHFGLAGLRGKRTPGGEARVRWRVVRGNGDAHQHRRRDVRFGVGTLGSRGYRLEGRNGRKRRLLHGLGCDFTGRGLHTW